MRRWAFSVHWCWKAVIVSVVKLANTDDDVPQVTDGLVDAHTEAMSLLVRQRSIIVAFVQTSAQHELPGRAGACLMLLSPAAVAVPRLSFHA